MQTDTFTTHFTMYANYNSAILINVCKIKKKLNKKKKIKRFKGNRKNKTKLQDSFCKLLK